MLQSLEPRGSSDSTGATPLPWDAALLRPSVGKLWPSNSQADTLKRELALLLLEDPDWRLRLAHCDEIMGTRLPGIYATRAQQPPGAPAASASPIHSVIAQDASCQRIFCLELPPAASLWPASSPGSSPGSGLDPWHHALLRLDLPELLRRCSNSSGGSTASSGVITSPVAAGAIAAAATAASSRSSSTLLGAGSVTSSASSPPPPWPVPGSATAGAAAPGIRLAGMETSLLRCVLATWPRYETDDDSYLAIAMAVLLVCRQYIAAAAAMPPCSLSLSQLQAGLQSFAANDERLHGRVAALEAPRKAAAASGSGGASGSSPPPPAGAPIRSASARASAGKFQELVSQPRFKGLFKMRDAPIASGSGGGRRADKIISLCVDKLSPAGQAQGGPGNGGGSSAGLELGIGPLAATSELPQFMLAWLRHEADVAAQANSTGSGSGAAAGGALVAGGALAGMQIERNAALAYSSPSSHASTRTPSATQLLMLPPGSDSTAASAMAGFSDTPSSGLPSFLFEYEAPEPLYGAGSGYGPGLSSSNGGGGGSVTPHFVPDQRHAQAHNVHHHQYHMQHQYQMLQPPPQQLGAGASSSLQGTPTAPGGAASGSPAMSSFSASSPLYRSISTPEQHHAYRQQHQQQYRYPGPQVPQGPQEYGYAYNGMAMTGADGPVAGGYGNGGSGAYGSSVGHQEQASLSISPFASAPTSSSPPGGAGAGGGGGRASLFSTSPNMQSHIPREVANCWGGPAALAATSARHQPAPSSVGGAAPGEAPPPSTPPPGTSVGISASPGSTGGALSASVKGTHGGSGNATSGFQTDQARGSTLLPPSPASALDAACSALLAGSSMGSVEGPGGPDALLWSSSSPEGLTASGYGAIGSAGRTGQGSTPGATGGQYMAALMAARSGGGAGAGAASAAAVATGRVPGGSANGASSVLPTQAMLSARAGSSGGSASNGQHCTPSSTSDVSEDCGVHGPPDIETTLEALLAFERPGLVLQHQQHWQVQIQQQQQQQHMPSHSPQAQHAAPERVQSPLSPSANGYSSNPASAPGVPSSSLGPKRAGPSQTEPRAVPSSPSSVGTTSAATVTVTAIALASTGAGAGAAQSGSAAGASGAPGADSSSGGKLMTGWAAVAAKGPGPSFRSAASGQQGQEALGTAAAAAAAWRQAALGTNLTFQTSSSGAGSGLGVSPQAFPSLPPRHSAPGQSLLLSSHSAGQVGNAGGGIGGDPKSMFPRTSQRLRDDILQLLRTVPGLKAEDFDEGVLYQLGQKRSEDEARAALRTLLGSDVSMLQHPAAYLNHVIKNFHLASNAGAATNGMSHGGGADFPSGASLPSATVRANSMPGSSKAILQRLPLRLYRRLEDIVARCDHLEWKHFDAGVVKVMSQLAEISDDDVAEELELLQATDLSAVEYMPAYLNKRLNNRLWSKRKQQQQGSAR